jgi:4-hydroxybenzoate polyprenyltransferase
MIRSQIVGLLKASHFGPTMLVVSIVFLLSLTQFSIIDSLFIALAFLFGQFVVGWTNDLKDLPNDKAAMRMNKPLVAGTITEATLKISIGLALATALIVSLLSPLGVSGTAIHFLGLLSATAYNLKLKATVFSVVPYIVSFASLPWAIYVAAEASPPTWIVLGFILFASAFHFLNVLKDMDVDRDQEVMGLPQVLGRQKSIAMAILLAGLGIVNVVLAII